MKRNITDALTMRPGVDFEFDPRRVGIGSRAGRAPPEPRERSGILAKLRRSPMVGADLEFSRQWEFGRTVDL